MTEVIRGQEGAAGASEWDDLAAGEFSDFSETEFFAGECAEIERQFGERSGEVSEREFEVWEDDFRDNWGPLEKKIQGWTLEEQAGELTQLNYFKPGKTIEAEAGRFYANRQKQLREAIRGSDRETKEADLERIGLFYQAVNAHIDLAYLTPAETRDYLGGFERYDRDRTAAHNRVIRELNGLNDLAREYGTRPFTVRNFWTSDVPKARQTPEVAEKLKRDREIVQAYYTKAFGKRR